MKAEIVVVMDRDEIVEHIPYAMICETREGAKWCGRKLKERYEAEFTKEERAEASALFLLAHRWHLKTGVPDVVRMKASTMALWLRLAEFCSKV